MAKIIQVQLGKYRGVNNYYANNVECARNDYIILEVERGFEYGRVVSNPMDGDDVNSTNVKGKVVRKATQGDLKQIENNDMKVKDALNVCIRKITDRKLHMQIVKAEYTFDSSKIIFSFTAEGRIDFRNLVKDLARVFRVRIELKQIGVRDKAKIITGFGVCGRELCCSSYIKEFHALSIRMAKEQGLPLNPSRISGVCGRIKCCMAYEFLVYKEFSKNLPRMGEKVTISEGKGKIVDVNILKRTVKVDLGEGKIVKHHYPKENEK